MNMTTGRYTHVHAELQDVMQTLGAAADLPTRHIIIVPNTINHNYKEQLHVRLVLI